VPQIVENSVCTLRNLSYRLEVEMPSSRLLGNQELDSLLGFSSPAKELDYLCWGKRRRGRKRGGWPDDKVYGVLPERGGGLPEGGGGVPERGGGLPEGVEGSLRGVEGVLEQSGKHG